MANETKAIKNIKVTKREWNNVGNLIDFLKFRYKKEDDFVKWLIGIALVFLFSSSVTNVLESQTDWIRTTGVVIFIASIVFIVLLLIIQHYIDKAQIEVMKYLYKQKDKKKKVKGKTKKK
ncbi:hypothetical protein KAI04_03245 [Candidatus Pacearchaeota archaeon]|nr:hypothetical protein [Candidatus Pacearchaeota archaeon]